MIPKLVTIVALGVVVSAPWTALGQNQQTGLPAVFKNLRVLNKNISQKELKATMEGFTDQLGVKCTHCHILDEYEKDDFKHKRDARRMILLSTYPRRSLDGTTPSAISWTEPRTWSAMIRIARVAASSSPP